VAVLILEVIWAVLQHRSEETLEELLAQGSWQEQVEALALLTNRGDPEPLEPELLASIVRSDNPLLHEWTRTTNFRRFDAAFLEISASEQFPDGGSEYRSRFFDRFRLVKYGSITLSDLREFLASLKEDEAE